LSDSLRNSAASSQNNSQKLKSFENPLGGDEIAISPTIDLINDGEEFQIHMSQFTGISTVKLEAK
jgi:hypothetical protein